MGLLSTPPPREPLVPTEIYMTDGKRLVWILESDHAGALGEDVVTEQLVTLEKDDLAGEKPRWRIVNAGQGFAA